VSSSGRSEPSNGLEPFRRPLGGLGERSKAVSEALWTVARAWATGQGGPSGLKRAFVGSARRLEILTGSAEFRPFGDRDATGMQWQECADSGRSGARGQRIKSTRCGLSRSTL
jgi:hypothetical protein